MRQRNVGDWSVKPLLRDPSFWIAEALSVPGEVALVLASYHALASGLFDPTQFVAVAGVLPVVVWLRGHLHLRGEAVNAASRPIVVRAQKHAPADAAPVGD